MQKVAVITWPVTRLSRPWDCRSQSMISRAQERSHSKDSMVTQSYWKDSYRSSGSDWRSLSSRMDQLMRKEQTKSRHRSALRDLELLACTKRLWRRTRWETQTPKMNTSSELANTQKPVVSIRSTRFSPLISMRSDRTSSSTSTRFRSSISQYLSQLLYCHSLWRASWM